MHKCFPSRIDVYTGSALASFLTALFERLVVTSTQVELQLSGYSHITDNRQKRLGLFGLLCQGYESDV